MKMVKEGLTEIIGQWIRLRDEAEAPEHVSSKESKLSEDSKSQRCGKCSGPCWRQDPGHDPEERVAEEARKESVWRAPSVPLV